MHRDRERIATEALKQTAMSAFWHSADMEEQLREARFSPNMDVDEPLPNRLD
jgi:hypothetical protein